MKVKYPLLSFAALCALGAAAQQANVFASALTVNKTEGNTVEVSFTLNADCPEVAMLIGGKEFDLGSGARGVNTKTVTIEGVEGTNLPWRIRAEAQPVTHPMKIDDKTTCPNMDFHHARCVTLDNNLESPFFGRVYVTESGHTATSRTSNGLYVYNSAFEDITGQGDTPYTGNAGFEATSASPQRVFVAPDALYLCDWSDSHSGVWKADPANLHADFKPVFQGERDPDGLISNAGTPIAGSIVSLWVDGEGESTRLYTFDEDYNAGGLKLPILRYDIGTLDNPWTTAPSAVVFDNANGLEVNGASTIIPDATGWWISQYRWLENAAQPALIHYNTTTKTEDFNSATADPGGVLIGFSHIGGLAINEDGTLLAAANNDLIKVFEIGETAQGAPLLTLKHAIAHGLSTNRIWSIAFDVVNNLYIANDQGAGLASFALPTDGENRFTTPAHKSQRISIGDGGGKTGDVNGDDKVDVEDVNALINILLGKAPATAAANVDGQGGIDVQDVNTLINTILGK